MNPRVRCVLLLAVLASLSVRSVQADGVLDYVPPDALGYAVINDLAATNDKLVRVTTAMASFFEVLPPAPLTLIKAATGIGAGLDDQGDALVAMLPGSAGFADARPLLLAPVSDYAAFAASVNGDATGAVSRVTIMGEEVLVAKRGDYALVMNLEHRPTMETILAAAPALAPEVKALAEWVTDNDVAIVLLSAGVDALSEIAQASLDADTAQLEQFSDDDNADILAGAKSINDANKQLFAFLGIEVASGGIGLSIDDATNVRLTHRLAFGEGARLAKLPPIEKPAKPPLAGHQAVPFVSAGGGPLPEGWPEAIARLTREIVQAAPDVYGFEDFDEAQWKTMEESWQATLDMHAISISFLVGEKSDPLLGNIYFLAETGDADKYLMSMRRSIELWNGLTVESSSDIKLAYEISDVRVADRPALLMSVDVAKAAADEDVPTVKPLLESIFGVDGILRFYVVAADDDTVVMAIAPEALATRAVETALSGKAGLIGSPEVQETASLLNPNAQWTWFVSPPGYAQWGGRFLANAMAPLGAVPFTLPEYPAGAPMGFSAAFTEKQFQAEMVVPAQTLKDLGDFVKKVQVQGL